MPRSNGRTQPGRGAAPGCQASRRRSYPPSRARCCAQSLASPSTPSPALHLDVRQSLRQRRETSRPAASANLFSSVFSSGFCPQFFSVRSEAPRSIFARSAREVVRSHLCPSTQAPITATANRLDSGFSPWSLPVREQVLVECCRSSRRGNVREARPLFEQLDLRLASVQGAAPSGSSLAEGFGSAAHSSAGRSRARGKPFARSSVFVPRSFQPSGRLAPPPGRRRRARRGRLAGRSRCPLRSPVGSSCPPGPRHPWTTPPAFPSSPARPVAGTAPAAHSACARPKERGSPTINPRNRHMTRPLTKRTGSADPPSNQHSHHRRDHQEPQHQAGQPEADAAPPGPGEQFLDLLVGQQPPC